MKIVCLWFGVYLGSTIPGYSLSGDISRRVQFGTCEIEFFNRQNDTWALVSIHIDPMGRNIQYVAGGSYWFNPAWLGPPRLEATSGRHLTDAPLEQCVAGSSADEFQLISDNGAEVASSYAADDEMGFSFRFRGELYEYKLAGASGTRVVASPDRTVFPPKSVAPAIDPVKETNALIGDVLEQRARMTLQNQPRLSRRFRRLTEQTGLSGSLSAFGVRLERTGLPFDIEIDQSGGRFAYSSNRMRDAEGRPKARLDPFALIGMIPERAKNRRVASAHEVSFSDPALLPGQGAGGRHERDALSSYMPLAKPVHGGDSFSAASIGLPKLDIWSEGHFGYQSSGSGDVDFAILHAGLDYLLNPEVLVGFGLQLDWSDHQSGTNSKADGFGFLAGPYMTARLTDKLYLDSRLAWGQSYTDISPMGTYRDELKTNRFLVSAAILGGFDWRTISIMPQLRLSYYLAESENYTDQLGASIKSNLVETGLIEFGPTFERRFQFANGATLTPRLAVDGVWTFAQSNSGSGESHLSDTDFHAKVEFGVDWATDDNLIIAFDGRYDGIGQSDYEAYGGSLQISKKW